MKKKMYLLKTIVCLLCLLGLPNIAMGVTIEVPTEGTLEQVIDDSDEPSFPTLKIVGRLNAADIAYLRTGVSRLASIQVLDLSDVTLVSGDEVYASMNLVVDDGLMSNATATFYIADENRMESSYQGNMMGGRNYTYKYYSNNLAGAFAQMNYKQVVLPKGQKEIGEYAFYKCENLTSVVLDGDVERIGEFAFFGCSSLQDMDLSHVTEMGSAAFAACPLFRGNEEGTVNLSSLSIIPQSAFGTEDVSKTSIVGNVKNTAIKHIVFSNQLIEISFRAFNFCNAIENIELPEGLLTIGDYAFADCSSLTSVSLPSNISGLNRNAFANTPFLNNLPAENGVVYLATTALYYKGASKDFDLVIREGTTEIGAFFLSSYNSSAAYYLKSVQLPSTLKRIGNWAFSGASKLTSIVLPEGLEEIGSYAFSYCTGIESLELPSTLRVIGDRAFQEMEKVTTIVLPESLESIGDYAFYGCPITGEVTIPRNVKQLGCFIFDSNVWRINYQAEDAKHVTSEPYIYTIFSPERVLIGANVRSLPEKTFSSSLVKKVTFEERSDDAELVIGERCFAESSITTITLPKGKIEIGGGTFYRCRQLASFSTLGVVTKIGDSDNYCGAFEGTQLTEFIVPDGLTYVGDNAFSNIFGSDESVLTTVHLGNSVKHIGSWAFSDCNALTDIQFGDQVESIGARAFNGCTSLSSFTIPDGVTAIEESTFGRCPFTEITIPASVKSIGRWAFASCTQLTAVHVTDGLEEIGEEAFSNCDLREFTLPSTIKALGKSFLGGLYASANPNMTDIYALMPVPLEMSESDYPFSGAYFNNPYRDVSHYVRCVLHVPSGSLQQYRETYPWSRFKTIVEIEEDENDYALTVDNIKCSKAKTTMLTVSLKNKEVLAGLQFELVLPSGVIVAEDENPERPVVLTERGDGLSVMHSKNENGGYTFLIVSLSGSKINGNEGALLNIPLYVGDNAPEGEQLIVLKQIFATTESGKTRYFKQAQGTMTISSLDYTLGDANGDGNVNVTDIVETVSYILNKPSTRFIFTAADVNQDGIVNVTDIVNMVSIIMSPAQILAHAFKIALKTSSANAAQVDQLKVEDVVLTAGEEKPIAIELVNNERLYSAFQFDLVLPEGVSIATNSRGKYVASLDAERMEDHSLSVEKIGDNTYRFVAFSLTNAEFYGNSGTLVNLTLKAADVLTKDDKTAQIVAQAFTTKSALQYNLADISFAITAPADPITIMAKSYTREYGDQNPVFEYTSEGAELNGTPTISCSATQTSPVGTYPIIITKGSVTNENDTYVNGTLTITKAPLTISAGTYTKKQYDPMPEFVPSFEGFKNGETNEVLTKQPVLSCEAKEDSAPGEYPIVVSGADATNYQIQYNGGVLTVTEPDSYTLTYLLDGEEYQKFSVKYRDSIVPLEEPSKEGYTFSGWSEIPTTMPAKDVTVTGTFAVNSYTLTYQVDGTEYKKLTVEYGTTINPETEPTKEGYTFSGWDGLPRSMPAKDIVVKGYFTINSYTITYVLDDEVYTTETLEYGAKVIPPVISGLEDYTIWESVPETMPANDITIYGKAKDIIDSLTPTLYSGKGEVFDLNGRKLSATQKGLNIIRMSDGTVKKTFKL